MNFRNEDFVHWHCHSEFSQFDGLAKLDQLVLQARKMGFPAMAITDHGNIMGWIKFLKECRATKDKKNKDIPYPPIKPILGCEMYISRQMDIGQYDDKKRKAGNPKKLQPDGRKGNRHINVFAMNYEGYKNICRLSQASFTKGFYSDPRIDINILDSHSEGVMGGSACMSSLINVNLMHGRYKEAKKATGLLNEIFKGNFFLEAMYHGIPEEKEILPYIFKLSKELDIPVICTNDSHYIHKEQGPSQEVLMCMSQGRCLRDPKRLSFTHMEFYLKSAQEMAKIFGSHPECFVNSVRMAERINSKDIEENLFGGMRLPRFNIPEEYSNPYDYLKYLAWEGMKRIGWDKSKLHVEALNKELEDILVAKESNNYDFSTYFLIVRDYVIKAKEKGIFVGPGRGSGYSSVLLRCLGITYGVDPVKTGLIWERFLGFDDKKFVKETDFGFKEDRVKNILEKDVLEDLDEDREYEQDRGGVDRY
jgi:DNA polymerase III subunit alpha